MMEGQVLPAFISKLIQGQGISPDSIECAVNEVLDIKLGESINNNDQLVRAFATEQAGRLKKAT